MAYIPKPDAAAKMAKIAAAKGAKAMISSKPIEGYKGIAVENPLKALIAIVANIKKTVSRAKTVCITGSIGKTTTTQMMYAVLADYFKTHRSTGSANNVRYTARNIQRLRPDHTAYVQETQEGPPYMCARQLSYMTQPDIAIVTKVGSSHLEEFGSVERIAESCLAIQDGMDQDGVMIVNADDPEQMKGKINVRKVSYGIKSEDADFRATDTDEETI